MCSMCINMEIYKIFILFTILTSTKSTYEQNTYANAYPRMCFKKFPATCLDNYNYQICKYGVPIGTIHSCPQQYICIDYTEEICHSAKLIQLTKREIPNYPDMSKEKMDACKKYKVCNEYSYELSKYHKLKDLSNKYKTVSHCMYYSECFYDKNIPKVDLLFISKDPYFNSLSKQTGRSNRTLGYGNNQKPIVYSKNFKDGNSDRGNSNKEDDSRFYNNEFRPIEKNVGFSDKNKELYQQLHRERSVLLNMNRKEYPIEVNKDGSMDNGYQQINEEGTRLLDINKYVYQKHELYEDKNVDMNNNEKYQQMGPNGDEIIFLVLNNKNGHQQNEDGLLNNKETVLGGDESFTNNKDEYQTMGVNIDEILSDINNRGEYQQIESNGDEINKDGIGSYFFNTSNGQINEDRYRSTETNSKEENQQIPGNLFLNVYKADEEEGREGEFQQNNEESYRQIKLREDKESFFNVNNKERYKQIGLNVEEDRFLNIYDERELNEVKGQISKRNDIEEQQIQLNGEENRLLYANNGEENKQIETNGGHRKDVIKLNGEKHKCLNKNSKAWYRLIKLNGYGDLSLNKTIGKGQPYILIKKNGRHFSNEVKHQTELNENYEETQPIQSNVKRIGLRNYKEDYPQMELKEMNGNKEDHQQTEVNPDRLLNKNLTRRNQPLELKIVLGNDDQTLNINDEYQPKVNSNDHSFTDTYKDQPPKDNFEKTTENESIELNDNRFLIESINKFLKQNGQTVLKENVEKILNNNKDGRQKMKLDEEGVYEESHSSELSLELIIFNDKNESSNKKEDEHNNEDPPKTELNENHFPKIFIKQDKQGILLNKETSSKQPENTENGNEQGNLPSLQSIAKLIDSKWKRQSIQPTEKLDAESRNNFSNFKDINVIMEGDETISIIIKVNRTNLNIKIPNKHTENITNDTGNPFSVSLNKNCKSDCCNNTKLPRCTKSGYFSIKNTNCKKYVQCIERNSKWVMNIFQCSEGYLFSPNISKCTIGYQCQEFNICVNNVVLSIDQEKLGGRDVILDMEKFINNKIDKKNINGTPNDKYWNVRKYNGKESVSKVDKLKEKNKSDEKDKSKHKKNKDNKKANFNKKTKHHRKHKYRKASLSDGMDKFNKNEQRELENPDKAKETIKFGNSDESAQNAKIHGSEGNNRFNQYDDKKKIVRVTNKTKINIHKKLINKKGNNNPPGYKIKENKNEESKAKEIKDYIDKTEEIQDDVDTAEDLDNTDKANENKDGIDIADENKDGIDIANENKDGIDIANENKDGIDIADENKDGIDIADENKDGIDEADEYKDGIYENIDTTDKPEETKDRPEDLDTRNNAVETKDRPEDLDTKNNAEETKDGTDRTEEDETEEDKLEEIDDNKHKKEIQDDDIEVDEVEEDEIEIIKQSEHKPEIDDVEKDKSDEENKTEENETVEEDKVVEYNNLGQDKKRITTIKPKFNKKKLYSFKKIFTETDKEKSKLKIKQRFIKDVEPIAESWVEDKLLDAPKGVYDQLEDLSMEKEKYVEISSNKVSSFTEIYVSCGHNVKIKVTSCDCNNFRKQPIQDVGCKHYLSCKYKKNKCEYEIAKCKDHHYFNPYKLKCDKNYYCENVNKCEDDVTSLFSIVREVGTRAHQKPYKFYCRQTGVIIDLPICYMETKYTIPKTGCKNYINCFQLTDKVKMIVDECPKDTYFNNYTKTCQYGMECNEKDEDMCHKKKTVLKCKNNHYIKLPKCRTSIINNNETWKIRVDDTGCRDYILCDPRRENIHVDNNGVSTFYGYLRKCPYNWKFNQELQHCQLHYECEDSDSCS